MLLLGALYVRHFLAVGILYIFANFLENKIRSEEEKYTTFINSSWGISGRKMREINFSSMSHIFVIPRGLRGHSLLTCLVLSLELLANAHVFTVTTKDLLNKAVKTAQH